jgi:tetratricopeptide (TPR) repeat protein
LNEQADYHGGRSGDEKTASQCHSVVRGDVARDVLRHHQESRHRSRTGPDAQGAAAAAPEVSQEAKKAFEGAVELYQIQKKTGNIDYQALIEAFREVIRQNPRAAEAYYNLGCLYEAIRDEKQAAESYQKAQELRPDLAPAARQLGRAAGPPGKAGRGTAGLPEGPEQGAENSQVLLNMASIYHQQKKLDEALRSAGEVLVRDPTNVGAYRIMAAVYYDKGDLDMAHLICLRGLVVKKDDPKLLNTLGLVLLGLKRVPEALASFRQGAGESPRHGGHPLQHRQGGPGLQRLCRSPGAVRPGSCNSSRRTARRPSGWASPCAWPEISRAPASISSPWLQNGRSGRSRITGWGCSICAT